jgi:hypothetical protein
VTSEDASWTDGDHLLRVSFRQYDGELSGRCWCGRTWSSANPRDMWEWLEDHEHAASDGGPAGAGGPDAS